MSASARTLLALLLALTLSSCGSWPRRAPEPKPPLIDCGERRPRSAIPALPTGGVSAWQRYTLRLLGLLEERDTLSAETADCLDRHREVGDIR